MNKLFTISELAKILNLVDPSNKKPLNHILRYWEKNFNQIKAKKINNRRYYSIKQVEIAKMIKFLLKNKGMTIPGVKNIMNSKINKLDVCDSDGLKADYHKQNIKDKSLSLLKKIERLNKYGKKNSSKS